MNYQVKDYDLRESGLTIWADSEEGEARAEFGAVWLLQSYAETHGWYYDKNEMIIVRPDEKDQTCISYKFPEFLRYLKATDATQEAVQSMVDWVDGDVTWDVVGPSPETLEEEARRDYLDSVL